MSRSKVKQIETTGQTWRSKSGTTMYVYDVALEDGTFGQANSTSEVGPPYAIGDEVEYEVIRQNQYGKTLSIKKFDPENAGGFTPNPARQKEIATQWSINAASSYLAATDKEDFIVRIGDTAQKLLAIKGWIMEKDINPDPYDE